MPHTLCELVRLEGRAAFTEFLRREHRDVGARADPDRTAITGYSMGGYMTYRLGLLMPDAFSKAADYVGPPAYQLWFYPAPPVPGDKYTAIGRASCRERVCELV